MKPITLSCAAALVCLLHSAPCAADDAGPIETESVLWKFDSAERWHVWSEPANKRSSTVTASDAGTRLVLRPAQGDTAFPLLSSNARGEGCLRRPVALRISVELVEGAASIGLNLQDHDGEGMHVGSRRLRTGANTLTWPIADGAIVHSWGAKKNKRLDGDLRLWNLMVTAATPDESVVLRMKKGTAVYRSPELSLVDVSLDTGNPIAVLTGRDADRLDFVLASRAPVSIATSIEARMTDFFGETAVAEADLDIAPGTLTRWRVPSVPAGFGVWWVEYTLTGAKSGASVTGVRTFARIEPALTRPGREEGFLFSTNGIIPRDPDPAGLAKSIWAARQIGVEVSRDSFGWEMVQPQRGRWDEGRMKWFDEAVTQLMDAGIEVQHLLAYCAMWAADPARSTWKAEGPVAWLFTPPPIPEWNAYVARMVERFGDRVKYWEVWNEADLSCFWTGTADQYTELLSASHATIKRIDPALRVMTCGFATLQPHGDRKTPDLMARVARDARGRYDILAFHEHHRFDNFRKSVDGPLADIRRGLDPDFPLYFNETSCGRGGDEQEPAVQLVKKLTYARSVGAMGYTQYNFRSGNLDTSLGGHNWGMLTGAFDPVASYGAYNALVRALRDKRFVEALDLGAGRFGFVFSGTVEHTVVLWADGAAVSGAPVTFLVDRARAISRVDMMGNAAPLVAVEGRASFALSALPQYLLVRSKRAPTLAEPFVSTIDQPVVIPGRRLVLRTRLVNSYSRSRTFRLRWQFPPELAADPVEESVRLGGRERRVVEHEVVAPRTSTARTGDLIEARLHYSIARTPWRDVLTVPLRMGAFVDTLQRDGDPVFTLDDKRQVRNLFVNLPQKEHLTWQGPPDLSARVWLGVSRGALELKVVVRDDTHVQRDTGGGIWRGDSIQLGIARPGWKGYYEIGLAHGPGGRSGTHVWLRPQGGEPLASSDIRLTTTRRGASLEYSARMPLRKLGLDRAALEAGLRFNLIVNDNDGAEREGWVRVAPGLGIGKAPEQFALVVFGF